jgi:hypothetical protein
MKVKDIITDDLVSKYAVQMALDTGDGAVINWRALKLALMGACEMTLIACGYGTPNKPLEVSVVNDDGSWGL